MSEGRVAAGFYRGRAIAGSEQYAINEKNGNESIAIDLDLPSLGRQFTTFLHFSDAAAPYAVERLRACGWQGDDLSSLAGIDRNEVDVQIKYETYEGKERMKVDIAMGGGRVKLENQMSAQQKRVFAARMKSFLKGGSGTPSPPARRPAQPTGGLQPSEPLGDDSSDIPFAFAGDLPWQPPMWERW